MNTPTKDISYRRRPLCRESPALNPVHVRATPVSLGRPPSLHGLRRPVRRTSRVILPSNFHSRIFSLGRSPHGPLFTRFPGTTGTSDFPGSCIDGVRLAASRRGPTGHGWWGNPWISRLPLLVRRCVPSSLTARDSQCASREVVGARDVAFRFSRQRRHPGVGISRLNGPPASPPTSNASAGSSRNLPHDGGRCGSLRLQRSRLSLYTPGRL
jgi:hypothetical protein